jgi:hypothetical protein
VCVWLCLAHLFGRQARGADVKVGGVEAAVGVVQGRNGVADVWVLVVAVVPFGVETAVFEFG